MIVIPSAAPWVHRLLLNIMFPAVPSQARIRQSSRSGSAGGCCRQPRIRRRDHRQTWSLLDLETMRLMVAFCATAPAHSTSKMASISSPLGPGSRPGLELPDGIITVGAFIGSPNWD